MYIQPRRQASMGLAVAPPNCFVRQGATFESQIKPSHVGNGLADLTQNDASSTCYEAQGARQTQPSPTGRSRDLIKWWGGLDTIMAWLYGS